MKQQPMGPILGPWFKGMDETPPDPQECAREVMARLPEVRQRGRWSPFPLFHRKAQTPTATGTAEYRPSPIPATNGHAPTVIGRTQTMFSPAKAITAGALVFALGGVLFIAQPFDQQGSVPGAEQGAELAPPVEVTITYSGGEDLQEEQCPTTGDTPPTCTRGYTVQFSATDPRLSGTATEWVSERTWEVRGGLFEAYAIEIVNDEGAWVGTGRHVDALDQSMYTLTGEGAYEGLAAFLTLVDDREDLMRAVIVEGGLPPFPEMPAE